MSTDISRRNFIKGTATAVAAVTAAGILGGCNSSGAVAKSVVQTYRPGTYEAKAYGNISYITVRTTFSEHAIEKIEVIDQHETPVLFKQVQDNYIPQLIETQSGGIDTISGATNSSRAVREAVADCIKQAGGDADAWLGRTVKHKAGADETYDADVVIVGLGGSGFMAALTAAKNGAKVVVV